MKAVAHLSKKREKELEIILAYTTIIIYTTTQLFREYYINYKIFRRFLRNIKQNVENSSQEHDDDTYLKLSSMLLSLLYQDQTLFSFKFSQQLTRVIHGSCRKAHFKGKDALPQLDTQLAHSIEFAKTSDRPDLVLFTGDQVYIDDAAGPMLHAIQQVVRLLGLYHEEFKGSIMLNNKSKQKDIVNGACLGLLELNENGQEQVCKLILADGSMVSFKQDK
ncbi:hypothetical protein BAE46_12285 [Glaciecola punicea]|nr:hypothetical protein BAE46_12285 [Glaciecola punicea]